jgi:diacylglycerol kinase (ATP)
MKLLIVVNPVSGDIDKKQFLKEATKLCSSKLIEFSIFKTTGVDDEKNLKKAIREYNPDKVASAGGDGTTLLTAVCLKNTGIPMGIIPLGSANGMANDLIVNSDPLIALTDLIHSEKYLDLDLILINDKYFCIHIGDIGFNAKIIEDYSKDPRRGKITYLKYFIKAYYSKQTFEYEILANKEVFKGKAIMIGICNGRKYGTGVPLNKNGSPFDGKLELVLVNYATAKTLLRAGLSIFSDDYIDIHNAQVIECSEASIFLSEKKILQLDGEIIGKVDEIHAKVLKGAVRYISQSKTHHPENINKVIHQSA